MKSNEFLISLVCIGLFIATSSCSTNKKKIIALQSGKNSGVIELQEAAISASKSLRKLRLASDQDSIVKIKTEQLDPNIIGMGQIINVDWHGPLISLVNNIANIAHYRVKVFGGTPALPPLVSITKTNSFLSDVLKDATLQVNDRVRLVVYPASQVIEVHYLHGNL